MTGPTVFHFRCPPTIKAAVESVANDQMITPSAYVRRALALSLQADGMDFKRAEFCRLPRPRGSRPTQDRAA
jgi:hypothetical protein